MKVFVSKNVCAFLVLNPIFHDDNRVTAPSKSLPILHCSNYLNLIQPCPCFAYSDVRNNNTLWYYDYTRYHHMSEVSGSVVNVVMRRFPRSCANCDGRTTPVVSPQISDWMERVVTDNPELVSSSVYGETFEGRNITYLKVGSCVCLTFTSPLIILHPSQSISMYCPRIPPPQLDMKSMRRGRSCVSKYVCMT